MGDRQRGIEEQIRQAIEAGMFDDLPGKGEPLNLDSYPFEPQDWRLAHHVLRSSGYSLPWIEKRNEIEEQLEEARAELRHAYPQYISNNKDDAASRSLDGPSVPSGQAQDKGSGDVGLIQKTEEGQIAWREGRWQRAIERFREAIAEINARIKSYNLEVPASRFQRLLVDADEEIDSLKADSI